MKLLHNMKLVGTRLESVNTFFPQSMPNIFIIMYLCIRRKHFDGCVQHYLKLQYKV